MDRLQLYPCPQMATFTRLITKNWPFMSWSTNFLSKKKTPGKHKSRILWPGNYIPLIDSVSTSLRIIWKRVQSYILSFIRKIPLWANSPMWSTVLEIPFLSKGIMLEKYSLSIMFLDKNIPLNWLRWDYWNLLKRKVIIQWFRFNNKSI